MYINVTVTKCTKSLVLSDNRNNEPYINTNQTLHRRKWDQNPKVGQNLYVSLLWQTLPHISPKLTTATGIIFFNV